MAIFEAVDIISNSRILTVSTNTTSQIWMPLPNQSSTPTTSNISNYNKYTLVFRKILPLICLYVERFGKREIFIENLKQIS